MPSSRDDAYAALTDEALMTLYLQGDGAAFSALFSRYYQPLIGRMRRRGASDAEASDLVQQTFLQLHRARRDFRHDALLKPYLMTIALNVFRAHLRSRMRHPEHQVAVDTPPDPVDPTEPTDPVEAAESRARVRAALELLPESQRLVIEMHWFQGLAFREIAEGLGASLSAVKVRAFRGYRKLRELLPDPKEALG